MASSDAIRPSTKDLDGRLPLNVRNNWVLLHDPAGPADRAELLLLVGADTTRDRRTKLLQDAAARVPRVLASLRQQAEQHGKVLTQTKGPDVPPDPWHTGATQSTQQNPWESPNADASRLQHDNPFTPPRQMQQPSQHPQETDGAKPEPAGPSGQQPAAPPAPTKDDPWGFGGTQ
jgi:hypothetical protein